MQLAAIALISPLQTNLMEFEKPSALIIPTASASYTRMISFLNFTDILGAN